MGSRIFFKGCLGNNCILSVLMRSSLLLLKYIIPNGQTQIPTHLLTTVFPVQHFFLSHKSFHASVFVLFPLIVELNLYSLLKIDDLCQLLLYFLKTPGTQETGVSPMRFCVQAKDRFVVRIVKVTEKSVYLSTGQSPAALPPPPTPLNPRSLRTSLMDPDEMRFYQNKLLQPATGGTCVYVGFQAQLPALRTEFVTRSTSADEVNSLPMIVHRRRNVGKGIRLCFSCPLRGNGLKIEDFYSGTISQRVGSLYATKHSAFLWNNLVFG